MTADQAKTSDLESARRRRWNRITAGVIAAMVVIWGCGLLFRNPLRAKYWGWQVTRNAADERWSNAIVNLGLGQPWGMSLGPTGYDAAVNQADTLTRHCEAAVRLAGLRIMARLAVAQRNAAFDRQFATPAAQGEISLEFPARSRIVGRLGELLADPSEQVQAEAIGTLVDLCDANFLPAMAELARTARPPVACPAVAAIARLGPRDKLAELLGAVVRDAKDPDVLAQAAFGLSFADASPREEVLSLLVGLLEDERKATRQPEEAVLGSLDLGAMGANIEQLLRRQIATLSPASQPATAGPAIETPAAVCDHAIRALRKLTGEDLGFNSTLPPAQRRAAIQRWRDFVRSSASR